MSIFLSIRFMLHSLFSFEHSDTVAQPLVTGVKLVMEGPPGQVGPLQKMRTCRFTHFTFEGSLSDLEWALLSLGWAP